MEQKRELNIEKDGSERKDRRKHQRKQKQFGWNGKQIVCSLLLVLATVSALIYFAVQEQRYQQSLKVSAKNGHDPESGYREIEYDGKHYQYNPHLQLVLYAGVDSTGIMESSAQYGDKARADVIALIIMDESSGKMSILPISRDTITKVRRYALNGSESGQYETQIGYAYSYGDGGRVSCTNLCDAVSNLLGGIPIREYIVTNQDSMTYINSLLGEVALTVPNADLQWMYPEFFPGNWVAITQDNVSTFLQYRNTEDPFSNEGRMQRQRAYASAYIQKMKTMTLDELMTMFSNTSGMKDYVQTSINEGEYLGLMQTFQNVSFSDESFTELEGENQTGELHDEFHPDQEALQRKIIELFYVEM